MLPKSQLIEVFKKSGFHPLKRLGENYLIDANIKDKIIASADIKDTDTIIEIGPGLGALTFTLASSGARVYAVEKDKKAYSILKDLAGNDLPNLKLFNADILEFDLKAISGIGKLKVVGNLPYYITTPIIEYLINNRKSIKSILITVQKEVANRLLAAAGSDSYSSISCFVQYYTRPRYIHTIRRTSFYPVPEVDSSLIGLEVLEMSPRVNVGDEELFFRLIRGAFNQRRKAILNSLSRDAVLGISKEKLSKVLKEVGIDPAARPEKIGLSAFARLANSLAGA